MHRTLTRVAALLLLSGSVHAAITYVAGSTCQDAQAAPGNAVCAATKPTGTADNDLLVFFVSTSQTGATDAVPTLSPPTGLTVVANETYTAGGADIRTVVYTRTASSEGASYTFTANDDAAATTNYVGVNIIALRGNGLHLDVTYAAGSHRVQASNTINPDAPNITTATNGAWVITGMNASHNEITAFGAPSGWTLRTSVVSSSYRSGGIATKEEATAGASAPGVWTNTGTASAAESQGITIAVSESASCPAACAGGRTAVCITDTSGSTDADNILNGQSPAVAANADTLCYDATSDILSDAISVSAAGWPVFASAGDVRTDDFDYCIMDAGTACGTDGTYQVTQTPTLSAQTGTATGTTTADLAVTVAQVEGTVYACVQASSVATPSHAQIAAGNNGAGAACTYAANDATPAAAQTFSATGLTAGTSYESCFGQANGATTPLTATVICSDAFITVASGDTTPDAFTFTDLQGVATSTYYCSQPVTITGIDAPSVVSVTGGEYRINSGAAETDQAQISAGDTLMACAYSSSEDQDVIQVTVTVGGQSDVWVITTRTLVASACGSLQSAFSDSIGGAINECDPVE